MRKYRIVIALGLLGAYSAWGQSYSISTIAGGGLPVNIGGTAASLGLISSLAVDRAGNVFFALSDRHVVLRLDQATRMLTLVAGTGVAGSSGDNGPATSAQLFGPSGVAVDAAGNVYIADTNNNRIRKVSNGVITTVAGNGSQGYSGDNGFSTSASLSLPSGVAVDAAGNLYIADAQNYRIRKVSNGAITTVAGNGIYGYNGDNGSATGAELNQPVGVAVDAAGNLYIADSGSSRIRKVANGVIATVAGNGTASFAGDNGPAASASLNGPRGVSLDAQGNLYIADSGNNCIRKVANGVITTLAGNPSSGLGSIGDNGPATNARLFDPYAVTVDAAGNVYIADSLNYRLREISGGVIATVAGNGTDGYSGDDGQAASAQLSFPSDVAVDAAGNLYIADLANYSIRKVSDGVITTVAGTGIKGNGDTGAANTVGLVGPFGVGLDAAGTLYIADNTRIRKVSNGVITTVAGSGAVGDGGGDNGQAINASLSFAFSVAADSAGNLYIVERGFHRVRRISNGVITTVAGIGFPAYNGDNAQASSAALSFPSGVAVDAAGNLYIADTGNFRIRKVSPDGGITTVAGNGKFGYSGDSGPATSAELEGAMGVAVDAAGNLYIADGVRIRKVSNGVITTVAGSTSPFPDNAQWDTFNSVAVDAAGNLYIADSLNNRVRLLTPAGSSCSYSVTPSSVSSPAAGGISTVNIQTAAGCRWNVFGLPSWMTVSGSTYGSGPATVTLVASVNPFASRTATLSVAGASVTVTQPGGAFGITTSASLPSGSVGGAYVQTLNVSGGTPPYTWSVASGALPSGLALSASGSITGTPAAGGTSTFTVQVTDSTTATTTQTFMLTIIAAGNLSRAGILSQLVSDGGWKTSVSLVNTGSSAIAVRLVLHANDGTLLSLPLAVTQQGTTQTLTANTVDAVIDPNSTLLVETTSQSGSTVEGWGDVLSSGPVNGFGIFRYAYSGSSASEGTVPLEAQPSTTLDLPYDNTAGYTTGVALANLWAATTTITATIWGADGTQLGVQSIALPGNGHTSFVLTDRFLVTAGQKGLIQFQSSAGIGGLGLRFSPSFTFTSVPTIAP